MDPFYLTGWLLVIVILTMLVAYFVPRKKPKAVYGTDDGMPDVQTSGMNISFDTIKRTERTMGRHPALDAPFGKRTLPPVRKPVVVLTPRQMEGVNIKRRLRGQAPLNRAGFKNAISVASTQPQQPNTSNDWLTYFIMYEVMFSGHQSPTCSGAGGFTIDPNLPDGGHGGQYAGAGASGSWTDAPSDVTHAAALISDPYGSGSRSFDVVTDKPDTSDTSTYTPDPAPSTPSYTAPSVSDSSSSYSSSSSDSSSSSSDSGSSGGGGD